MYAAVVAVVSLQSACGGGKGDAPKAPVSVSVVTVGGSAARAGGEYVGTVVERSGTALSFEVPGNVLTLRADQGDRVARGQLLATIDPASLRDAYRVAQSALRQAQDAYRRFEPLHSQGVVSDIRWVEIQTQLEQAQSAERMARTQLSRTSLVAPFAGVIAARTAERGMNVMAGQQIYRLVDISRVDIRIAVPEGEVSAIRVGAKARVEVPAAGGVYGAVVAEKGIEANAVSHTYDVKLAVDAAGGRLMPGMVGSVRMDGAAVGAPSGAAAIEVPVDAVKLDADNRRFVWTVEGGTARRQYVTVGRFTDGGVEITSGLKPGDRVVTDGSQKISSGMKVRVVR